jgi:glycosyltransferase involved in cell wall biosynthesis
MSDKKALFLYTELAGYTLNCMKEAMVLNQNLKIHVVRWPLVDEAPFQFNFENVKVYDRSNFDFKKLVELVNKENFDLIVCSGWVDKEYVKVCRAFKNVLPTVLALDNQWNGSPKQYLAKLLSPLLVKRNFTHAWVPGNKQFKFVSQLGFSSLKIRKGFYVADTNLFIEYYKRFKDLKEKSFPKRFLFVGRYVNHKGIYDMWNAFVKLHEETESDWELWCVGAGEEFENKINHPKIKHFGFLQPTEFSKVIRESGVYILPSHFEPWGVSVQEFAAAGYPMLLSKEIGSSEAFFIEGKNGYSFESNNEQSLLDSIKKIICLSEKELIDMQLKSIELSLSITTQEWSDSLMSFKL